ncbi:uncharacterized protein MELLADRAFT_96362 [Melampsora larici-populina 98AG31]|uniref:Uncharacterized protein n=1 Tax=Melampsora larici-populina (strain 98AG31 / pathotype 3-4-7) TaxID=747676 RepID=F4REH7_MELLP|nr:uncharacterized protein MELLADRAFT_96362 [Melampsora larici-populina 98AG31]EGG09093.1 hypothetical protein MELLADRAFT_96362 [Melampsora larici-populina 98AG31]
MEESESEDESDESEESDDSEELDETFEDLVFLLPSQDESESEDESEEESLSSPSELREDELESELDKGSIRFLFFNFFFISPPSSPWLTSLSRWILPYRPPLAPIGELSQHLGLRDRWQTVDGPKGDSTSLVSFLHELSRWVCSLWARPGFPEGLPGLMGLYRQTRGWGEPTSISYYSSPKPPNYETRWEGSC